MFRFFFFFFFFQVSGSLSIRNMSDVSRFTHYHASAQSSAKQDKVVALGAF